MNRLLLILVLSLVVYCQEVKYCLTYAEDLTKVASDAASATSLFWKVKLTEAGTTDVEFIVTLNSNLVTSESAATFQSDGNADVEGTIATVEGNSTITVAIPAGVAEGIIELTKIDKSYALKDELFFICNVADADTEYYDFWMAEGVIPILKAKGKAVPPVIDLDASYIIHFYMNKYPSASDIFVFHIPPEITLSSTSTCTASLVLDYMTSANIMSCSIDANTLTMTIKYTGTSLPFIRPYAGYKVKMNNVKNPSYEGEFTFKAIWKRLFILMATEKFEISIQKLLIEKYELLELDTRKYDTAANYVLSANLSREINYEDMLDFTFVDYEVTSDTTCYVADYFGVNCCQIDPEKNKFLVSGMEGVSSFEIKVGDIINPSSGEIYKIPLTWFSGNVTEDPNVYKYDTRTLKIVVSEAFTDTDLTIRNPYVGETSDYLLTFKYKYDIPSDTNLYCLLPEEITIPDSVECTIGSEAATCGETDTATDFSSYKYTPNFVVTFPSLINTGDEVVVKIKDLVNPRYSFPDVNSTDYVNSANYTDNSTSINFTNSTMNSSSEVVDYYTFKFSIFHGASETPDTLTLFAYYECGEGYFMDYEMGKCSKCVEPCQTCLDYETCLTCSDSEYFYYYQCFSECPAGSMVDSDADGKECMDCIIGCKECESNTTCETCMSGFFKNSDGVCEMCPENCTSCSDAATCSGCPDGMYLADNKCNVCNSPCATCDPDADTCTSCERGLFLSGSSCVTDCGENKFQENGECIDCESPTGPITMKISKNFALLTVEFEKEIKVSFLTIDRKNLCKTIFGTSYATTFGEKASCIAYANYLFVYPEYNEFSFSEGDTISVEDVIAYGDCSPATDLTFTIGTFPDETVSATIFAPEKVMVTSTFHISLNEVKYGGNKDFETISWSFKSIDGTTVSSSDSKNDIFDDYSGKKFAKIPANTLTAGKVYIFQVEIKNWYSDAQTVESGEVEAVDSSSSLVPDPDMVVNYYVYPYQSLILKTLTIFSSDDKTVGILDDRYSYSWSSSDIDLTDLLADQKNEGNYPKLRIPEYFFSLSSSAGKKSYTITCGVTYSGDSTLTLDIDFKIVVIPPPIDCKISGAGVYYENQKIVLSAENSTDYAVDYSTDEASLTYSWVCYDEDGNEGCDLADGTTFSSKTGISVTFSAYSFEVFSSMKFGLTCSRTADTSSTEAFQGTDSAMVKILPAVSSFVKVTCPSTISASPYKRVGMTCEVDTRAKYEFSWSSEDFEDAEFVSGSDRRRYLILSAAAMTPGREGKVELTVTDPEDSSIEGYGFINIDVLQYPTNGTLIIDGDLTQGFDSSVTLSAEGFEDPDSLECETTYKFYYMDSTSNEWNFLKKSSTSTITVKNLPCYNLIFKVRYYACNGMSGGAESEDVTITGCDSSSAEDLLEEIDTAKEDTSLTTLLTVITSSDSSSIKETILDTLKEVDDNSEKDDSDLTSDTKKIKIIKKIVKETTGVNKEMAATALSLLKSTATKETGFISSKSTSAEDIASIDNTDESEGLSEEEADEVVETLDGIFNALKENDGLDTENVGNLMYVLEIAAMSKIKNSYAGDDEVALTGSNFKGKARKITKKEFASSTLEDDEFSLTTGSDGLGDDYSTPVSLIALSLPIDIFKTTEEQLSNKVTRISLFTEDGNEEETKNISGVSLTLKLDKSLLTDVEDVLVLAKGNDETIYSGAGITCTNLDKDSGTVTCTITHFTDFTAVNNPIETIVETTSPSGSASFITTSLTILAGIMMAALML